MKNFLVIISGTSQGTVVEDTLEAANNLAEWCEQFDGQFAEVVPSRDGYRWELIPNPHGYPVGYQETPNGD